MHINPEFQRNIWLYVTLPRLLVFPVILTGSVYLLSLFEKLGPQLICSILFWTFIIITGALGANRVGSSTITEIQGRTWHLQRLTSISPWSMVWGKLFGSTVLYWYWGFWCLGAFSIFQAQLSIDSFNLFFFSEGLLPGILYLIGFGLFCQILGMMGAMAQLKDIRIYKYKAGADSFLTGWIIIGVILTALFADVDDKAVISWYGSEFLVVYFWLTSLYAVAGWCLLGNYLLMRKEFDMPNLPFVWIGFCVFLIFYCMGFEFDFYKEITGEHAALLKRIAVAFGFILFTTYVMLMWEKTDAFAIRQFLLRVKYRQVREALNEMPRGFISAILACAVGGWLVGAFLFFKGSFSPQTINPFGFVGAALCFMTRDLALIQFLNFSENSKSSMANPLILLILYICLPGIFYFMEWREWLSLFYPLYTPISPMVAIIPPLVQAMFMWTMVFIRWQGSKFCLGRLPSN